MPRTIVYHTEEPEVLVSTEEPVGFAAKKSTSKARVTKGLSKAAKDGYSEKLVKYIPAEVVGIFTPFAATLQNRPDLLWTLTIVCAIGTPAYLLKRAYSLNVAQRPPWFYYLLSTVAFCAWAVSSSQLGALIGLDELESGLILGGSVFLIPLIDFGFVLLQKKPMTSTPPGQ